MSWLHLNWFPESILQRWWQDQVVCPACTWRQARPPWCQTDTPTHTTNCYFCTHIHTRTHTYTHTYTHTSNRVTSPAKHSTLTGEHFESGATLPPRGLGNMRAHLCRHHPPLPSAPSEAALSTCCWMPRAQSKRVVVDGQTLHFSSPLWIKTCNFSRVKNWGRKFICLTLDRLSTVAVQIWC